MLPVSRLLTDLGWSPPSSSSSSELVSGMAKGDIDEVVLVGGTTRIPFVKDQLRCPPPCPVLPL
jgi:hypothetical protein